MKIYIAGKITGLENYRELFGIAEADLQRTGYKTMNPAVLNEGFTHREYMHVCYAMIDVCDAVYFLSNWKESEGAKMEFNYALEKNKQLLFEDIDYSLEKNKHLLSELIEVTK